MDVLTKTLNFWWEVHVSSERVKKTMILNSFWNRNRRLRRKYEKFIVTFSKFLIFCFFPSSSNLCDIYCMSIDFVSLIHTILNNSHPFPIFWEFSSSSSSCCSIHLFNHNSPFVKICASPLKFLRKIFSPLSYSKKFINTSKNVVHYFCIHFDNFR